MIWSGVYRGRSCAPLRTQSPASCPSWGIFVFILFSRASSSATRALNSSGGGTGDRLSTSVSLLTTTTSAGPSRGSCRFGTVAGWTRLSGDLAMERNRAVAVRWVEGYGVLGLTPHPRFGTWWPDPRCGTGVSVKCFVYEAWVANATLRLYEAALQDPM
jgi:hypothetical protein